MSRHTLRFLLGGLAVFAVLAAPLGARQEKEAPKKEAPPESPGLDYREFFKKPTNLPEFWKALQFELDVGRFDLAAAHLRGLMLSKPGDADLVRLADEVGIAAFLKLRNVSQWSDNPKFEKQARQDVEDLISQVTAAVKRVRGDPKRIALFIQNLLASPEENAYAVKELHRSGAQVVPYLIDAIRAASPDDRLTLLKALGRLGPETVPPLIAVLDSNDPQLQIEIIDLLKRRAAEEAVPSLWYLSASRTQPEDVREAATEGLAFFLGVPAAKLPPAKVALTQEAERYYRHQVRFPDPKAVLIWRWDGKRVVEGWPGVPTIPASKAEEYYGLKYAGQALSLDPAFEPAQVVWLSLALEKAQESAGLHQPLDKAAPAVHAMLASVSPALVNAVLERALKEGRPAVILGAVRELGARGEVRAFRHGGRSEPPLVQALYYPDRRVQFAAAEALLRIPGSAATQTTTRVVDILRRALAANPGAPLGVRPKVLVGYFDEDQANRAAAAVTAAGFEAIKVNTGRALMQRLGQAADIDLILMDEALPDPGLNLLLGQIRSDVHASQLPLVVTVRAEIGPDFRDQARSRARVADLWSALQFELGAGREDLAAKSLHSLLDGKTSDADLARLAREKGLDALEKLRGVRWSGDPKANESVRKEVEDLIGRVNAALRQPLAPPASSREDALRRFLARWPNATIVSEVILEDAPAVQELLQSRIAEPGRPALTPAERKDYAERSVVWLARLARGEPAGYDVRPATETILNALRAPSRLRPQGQQAAAEAAGRLPGGEVQTVLADVVLDGKRPLAVRVSAGEQLVRHIQTYGPLLSRSHVKGLLALYEQPATDAPLKAQLALVLGGLQPDARLTGQRLLQYQPPAPAPPAAPAPAPAPVPPKKE